MHAPYVFRKVEKIVDGLAPQVFDLVEPMTDDPVIRRGDIVHMVVENSDGDGKIFHESPNDALARRRQMLRRAQKGDVTQGADQPDHPAIAVEFDIAEIFEEPLVVLEVDDLDLDVKTALFLKRPLEKPCGADPVAAGKPAQERIDRQGADIVTIIDAQNDLRLTGKTEFAVGKTHAPDPDIHRTAGDTADGVIRRDGIVVRNR